MGSIGSEGGWPVPENYKNDPNLSWGERAEVAYDEGTIQAIMDAMDWAVKRKHKPRETMIKIEVICGGCKGEGCRLCHQQGWLASHVTPVPNFLLVEVGQMLLRLRITNVTRKTEADHA